MKNQKNDADGDVDDGGCSDGGFGFQTDDMAPGMIANAMKMRAQCEDQAYPTGVPGMDAPAPRDGTGSPAYRLSDGTGNGGTTTGLLGQ